MFRSVFIDARIVNPKTKLTAYLQFAKGGQFDDPYGNNFMMPFVNSFRYKSGYNVDYELSLSLTPTYDMALKMLSKDQPWFRLGNTLALRWGYADVPGYISDWVLGFMQVPEVSFGDEISFNINATAYGFAADRVARKRVWSTQDEQRTFKSIAEEIAGFYGWQVVWSKALSDSTKAWLESLRGDFVQGGNTDLAFLVATGYSNGAAVILRNNKLIFADANSPIEEVQEVAATFAVYKKIDIESGVFPMMGFSPEYQGTMFLRNYQGVATVPQPPDLDPVEDVYPVKASAATSGTNAYSGDKTAGGPSSEDGASDADPESGEAVPKNTVQADKGDVNIQMTAGRFIPCEMNSEFSEQSMNEYVAGGMDADNTADDHGITVNFETIGLPHFIPGMLCRVEGVGDYFSTVYMAREVEISGDTSGVSMSVVAGAKGFPGLNESFDTLINDVNKRQAALENVIPENPY